MRIKINPISKTILLTCLLFFVVTVGAQASGQSGGNPRFEPDKVAVFAKKVEKELAAKGVRVFIIARVGRPTSDLPSGIHYTHTAFAVYSSIETSDNRKVPGYAIYNLYQLDERPEKSQLVVDYPVDFFIGAHELRAGIIIPKPELQKRLLAVIGSDTYKSLHNPNYSALANPFTCVSHSAQEV